MSSLRRNPHAIFELLILAEICDYDNTDGDVNASTSKGDIKAANARESGHYSYINICRNLCTSTVVYSLWLPRKAEQNIQAITF